MMRRLIILLLIFGCYGELEDKSVYGYPDFVSICGMDEYGNPTENFGDGICGLCIYDQGSPIEQESIGGEGWKHVMPVQFSLSSPYPNPFNPAISATLSVPLAGYILIYIMDTDYNTIDTLVNGYLSANAYTITWDASSSPDGYYRIVAEYGDVQCFRNIYKKPYP